MLKFSDRMGITQPLTELQVNSMYQELRNSLYNLIYSHLQNWTRFYQIFTTEYLKRPVDECPNDAGSCKQRFKHIFLNAKWFEVYNIIEFILKNFESWVKTGILSGLFILEIDKVLERELSGWRVIDYLIVPISNEQEVEAIRQAISDSSSLGLDGVKEHLTNSLELLGKKPKPDYRNSI